MAQVTGTHQTTDIVGAREDLIDSIYNIDPKETPLLSMIGRGKADAVTHEWQTQDLEAPDGDNAQLEGDEAAFDTPSPSVRVGNVCQISRKTTNTSGTLEAISKAGRKSEEAFQWAMRTAELKLDMETILTRAQGATLGGPSTPRRLAALSAWLKTNTDFDATTGADPVYTSGVPGAARTDSSATRALTETIALGQMQSLWTNGGKAKVFMVGPHNRTVFSTFAGQGTVTINADKATATHIMGSKDVFVTDFGNLRVIPSRLQRERDAWFIDPSMLSVRYLRPFKTERLAKTGDAKKKQIIVEFTLRCNQEKGLAGVFDLNAA